MISDKLTLVSEEVDDEDTITTYRCDVVVPLAGDSLWDCELKEVRVTEIRTVNEMIYVKYLAGKDLREQTVVNSWTLYTDSGFEQAIRDLLGDETIGYTEQGMQDDNQASLEYDYS